MWNQGSKRRFQPPFVRPPHSYSKNEEKEEEQFIVPSRIDGINILFFIFRCVPSLSIL